MDRSSGGRGLDVANSTGRRCGLARGRGRDHRGCTDAEAAYRAIDWPTLFLIVSKLAPGVALEETQPAEVIARGFVPHIRPFGPWVMLSLFIFTASALTNFLSAASPRCPHADPRAFLLGVAFGASACFATPSVTR